jgi:hypothetical protein
MPDSYTDVIDPVALAAIPTERLEAEVQTTAAILAAATCQWLLQIAELDRREAWASWECRSMAHWLTWKCGVSLRTGREHVRVARELERLPRVLEEFAAGRLSYSKVRGLTRIVTAPELEADLVELALVATASQLDRIAGGCQRVRRINDPDREERNHDDRRLSVFIDDDGNATISARGPVDLIVELMTAVDAAVAGIAANDGEDIEARRFDALIEIGRRCLEPTEGADGEAPAAVIVVRTEEARPAPGDDGAADAVAPATARGWPISRAAYERLRCDAKRALERVLDDGSIERTPTTDAIPRRVRRAVRDRDLGCCRWPGCGARASIHLHHIVWRSHCGPNSIANLVSLCHFHHRAVHHRGWRILGDANGALRFVDAHGRHADERTYRRDRTDAGALRRAGRHYDIDFGPDTIATALNDRLDRAWAVGAICHNEEVLSRRRN